MAFIKARGIKGLIYVPYQKSEHKKNNCKDCFSCQWCSDERCELCLGKNCSRGKFLKKYKKLKKVEYIDKI